ncbi:MAG: zinc ABC transporter solute-binding protein [Deltaproteobacteria bacterium]|nr:zinc ABC transporter solute-binding protein [Deltaproteobacteria bacterium]MBT4015236.1 zinc ABC transporter solute-binding protein [Deltaproteobacteria bacterium]
MIKTGICLIIVIPLLCFNLAMAASDLKVVVSIKPFHSLVSSVMQGVSKPALLLNGNNSPHTYSLRPSAAVKLQNADLVFWGGENLEGFLAKPIHSLAAGAWVFSFEDTPGLILRPFRSGKEWQKLDHESENDQDHLKKQEIHRLPGNDPHIWLDPLNAQKIIQNLVQILSDLDPENANTYHSNGKKTILQLSDLNIQLETKMSLVSSKSYIVFHDAYQYFEKRYKLNPIASVTASSGHSTSVGRLIDIRKKIKIKNVLCIFTEPQFSPKLVETVISGTTVKTGILDPIGTSIPPGPEMYFTLLNNISHSISTCFKK